MDMNQRNSASRQSQPTEPAEPTMRHPRFRGNDAKTLVRCNCIGQVGLVYSYESKAIDE